MPTNTTEVAFPPLDSQATQSFIDDNVASAAQSGDIATDFKKALISILGLAGVGYSLDDLWKRYQLSATVTGDPDVQGPPSRTPPGHGGQHPRGFLPPDRTRNTGNTNGFPSSAPVVDPTFSAVVLQSNMEGTDGVQIGHADDTYPVAWTSVGATVVYDDAQTKFGSTSMFLPVGTNLWAGIANSGVGREDINTQPFSYECFARFTSVQHEQTFAAVWGASGRQWKFSYTQDDLLKFECSENGSGIVGPTTESWVPAAETWYHVAVCRNAADELRLFVDGQVLGTATANYTHNIYYDGVRSYLVGYDNNVASQFEGHIDAPRFVIGEGIYDGDSFTVPTQYYPTS